MTRTILTILRRNDRLQRSVNSASPLKPRLRRPPMAQAKSTAKRKARRETMMTTKTRTAMAMIRTMLSRRCGRQICPSCLLVASRNVNVVRSSSLWYVAYLYRSNKSSDIVRRPSIRYLPTRLLAGYVPHARRHQVSIHTNSPPPLAKERRLQISVK